MQNNDVGKGGPVFVVHVDVAEANKAMEALSRCAAELHETLVKIEAAMVRIGECSAGIPWEPPKPPPPPPG